VALEFLEHRQRDEVAGVDDEIGGAQELDACIRQSPRAARQMGVSEDRDQRLRREVVVDDERRDDAAFGAVLVVVDLQNHAAASVGKGDRLVLADLLPGVLDYPDLAAGGIDQAVAKAHRGEAASPR
jgi:hypothetical protein